MESWPLCCYEQIQRQPIADVLGFQVKIGEVIEIDDGLLPYYFHVCEYGTDVFTYFDRDRARKNKLEDCGSETKTDAMDSTEGG